MSFWRQPLFQILAIFLGLGSFAWWTFHSVSLPPSVRSLFEEDQAIAAVASPLPDNERFQKELDRLPAPPEHHAPEVAALLQRLQNLPPVPHILQVALQRNQGVDPDHEPPPWSEVELRALDAMRTAFRQAWLPFLLGPKPDWKLYPDSTALFRFQGDFLSPDGKDFSDPANQSILSPQLPEPTEDPELFLAYYRQIQNLGTLDLGGLGTDTVKVSSKIAGFLETRIIPDDLPPSALLAIREQLPPPPTLGDLREGLQADRALFLRIAAFLESLPTGTSAAAGINRWFGKNAETVWPWDDLGHWQNAADLANDLKRKASEIDQLIQKTFLLAAAWRQWLEGDPAVGLSPLLAQGIGGFRFFEETRSYYLVARGALDVRIALQTQGPQAARRVSDPLKADSFFQLEEKEGLLSTFCSYTRPGLETPVRFRIPESLAPSLNPAAEKTSRGAPSR